MKALNLISLQTAMPNEKLFAYMPSLSFVPDATIANYLDSEYFLNHSGGKQISPLVQRHFESENYVEATSAQFFANLILNRYKVKWETLFTHYSSLENLDILNNINLITETEHGKQVVRASTEDTSATANREGSESKSASSFKSDAETYDPDNPRKSERSIEGGYSDTGTSVNTRTGSQKVTEKGGTLSSVYGFNSSDPVPSTLSKPEDENGITSETTFGSEGLKDSETSGNTRTYSGYKDSVTESGSRNNQSNTAENAETTSTIAETSDTAKIGSSTELNSGVDKVTETGRKCDSLIEQYLYLFMSADYYDFLKIVYADCDEVLTCPFYV